MNYIAKDLEKWFDTGNYKFKRSLPKGKTKRKSCFHVHQIGWENNEKTPIIKNKNVLFLTQKTMIINRKIVTKIYKKEIKFEDYQNYLNASKIENEINILKDDNYSIDEKEEKYGKFWIKIKHCKYGNKGSTVISMTCHV